MSVEETLQRAQQGDINAMLAIADDYAASSEIEQALTWFEQAIAVGEKGSEQMQHALSMAMYSYTIKVIDDVETASWNDGFIHSSKLFSYATELLSYENSQEKKIELVQKGRFALYNAAICQHAVDEDSDALKTLGIVELNEPRATLLELLCRASLEAENTYHYLKIYETEDLRDAFKNTQCWREELMLAMGFFRLSLCYRLGMGVKPNINKAYDILQKGLSLATFNETRRCFSDELNHYKRSLFGGYSYIE